MVKEDWSEPDAAFENPVRRPVLPALSVHKFSENIPILKGNTEQSFTEPFFPTGFLNERRTIFAVMDAGRLACLPVLLETGNIPHMSLFSGDLAETGKDVAPYLAEFSEDNDVLRGLLSCTEEAKIQAGAFWDAQAGIFISTSMPLSDLRSHLRRFMRVLDAREKAYYFRFWQPEVAEVYFSNAATDPQKAARWVFPHDTRTQIDAIWAPVRNFTHDAYLLQFERGTELTRNDLGGGQFRLDRSDFDALHRLQWNRDVAKVADQLRQAFPQQVTAIELPLTAFCDTQMRRAVTQGFAHLDMLYVFCAWAINFGPDFESMDKTGAIAGFMQSDAPPEWRFEQIKTRMIALEETMG